MGGVRLGGTAILPPSCSPPFGALEGSGGDGDANVYRACTGNPAGDPSQYTNFDDGALTSEGIHNAVLSPNSQQILFEVANPSTGFYEIWVVDNTPGSTPTQLLADASNYYLMPSWHPDSDQFVCVHGASGVFLGAIESSAVSTPGTVTVLKNKDASNSPFRPQYNNDGSRIAYIFDSNAGPTGDFRVMDDDGTNDSSLDNAVKYRFQGPQFNWSHDGTMLAYDNGVSGSNAAYVILAGGTGKTQINANGDIAGGNVRVSDRAWPADDSYVIVSGTDGINSFESPTRAELDGSDTTTLGSHGAWLQDYFRQVIVANNRIWFIESGTVLGSIAIDGSDYQNYLTIDGLTLDDFSTGDGWFYN